MGWDMAVEWGVTDAGLDMVVGLGGIAAVQDTLVVGWGVADGGRDMIVGLGVCWCTAHGACLVEL